MVRSLILLILIFSCSSHNYERRVASDGPITSCVKAIKNLIKKKRDPNYNTSSLYQRDDFLNGKSLNEIIEESERIEFTDIQTSANDKLLKAMKRAHKKHFYSNDILRFIRRTAIGDSFTIEKTLEVDAYIYIRKEKVVLVLDVIQFKDLKQFGQVSQSLGHIKAKEKFLAYLAHVVTITKAADQNIKEVQIIGNNVINHSLATMLTNLGFYSRSHGRQLKQSEIDVMLKETRDRNNIDEMIDFDEDDFDNVTLQADFNLMAP